jgi:hypothetical protein
VRLWTASYRQVNRGLETTILHCVTYVEAPTKVLGEAAMSSKTWEVKAEELLLQHPLS